MLLITTTLLLLLAHSTAGAGASAVAAAAIYPPSSSSGPSSSRQRMTSAHNAVAARSSRWKWNTTHASFHHDATPSNRSSHDDDDSIMQYRHHRRQLSIADQLDILRLGFIPTASSSSLSKDDENGDDETKSRRNVNRIPRGGGDMIEHDGSSSSCQPSSHQRRQQQQRHGLAIRQLSTAQQLNILKRGFIPTSSSSSSSASSSGHVARFHRGGGHVVAASTDTATLQHRQQRFCIFSQPLSLASIFAFLAGYSNVLCYHKFQCYATMMTGNIVTMSIFLAEQQWNDALRRLIYVTCYLVGSVISRAIELGGQRCSSSSTSSGSGKTESQQQKQHYKVIAPMVVAIFAIAEKILSSSSSSSEVKYNIVIPILALGYGMVYATANRALNATMTQLLTGHVTKLGSSFSDYLICCGSKPWSGKKEVIMSCCILASFVLGGVTGSRLLDMVATGFPHFALLGLVYASVLVLF